MKSSFRRFLGDDDLRGAKGPRVFWKADLGGFAIAALGFPDDKSLWLVDANVVETALELGPVILWLAMPRPGREEIALGRG